MDNQEFDVLDELYFVKNFTELAESLDMDNETVKKVLQQLVKKHWVKILDTNDNEVQLQKTNFEEEINKYHFIATKAGLLAHNGR